jgi:hypothetical protein
LLPLPFTGLFAQNHNVPQNGLVAFYMFDGAAGDSSTNRKDGTVHSVPFVADRFGVIAKAAYFNGTSGYIDAPSSGAIQPSGAISISAWIKPDSTGNVNTILTKRFSTTADPYHSYELYYDPVKGRWCFAISKGLPGTLKALPAKMSYPFGSWMFIAGTYDGSSMKLYINGDLDTSMAFTGSLGYGAVSLYMGWSGTTTDYFKGAIDDVTLYNRALTAVEIAQMKNGTVGIQTISGVMEKPSVYPNPANEELFIDLKGAHQGELQIRDLTGKLIMQVSATDHISLGGIAKGIYFLTLTTPDNNRSTIKFVKE